MAAIDNLDIEALEAIAECLADEGSESDAEQVHVAIEVIRELVVELDIVDNRLTEVRKHSARVMDAASELVNTLRHVDRFLNQYVGAKYPQTKTGRMVKDAMRSVFWGGE